MTKAPNEIWKEYQRGVEYKTSIDLYENVRVNENFYNGKQWEGVNAPDLPKPTLNFLKRVVSYFTAMVVSDDVAVALSPYTPDPRMENIGKLLAVETERIIEQCKAKSLNREAVRNAAVDGDACMYLWFDPEAESGQDAKGRIRMELIENINLIFGNPYVHDVQKQRYIIIAQRKMLDEVREEAKDNGISEDEYMRIRPDSDEHQGEDGSDNQMVTVLIRLWREDGTIHATKTTENCVVKKAWDTEYKLFPIAYFSWEKVRSSCHGQAALTGLIQNQISVNRLFAMSIRSVEMTAFPKVIFDATKIKRWSNRVGEAIEVNGDVGASVMTNVRGADVSPQVMDIIDRVITMTRDFMGASDAALGNVKPDNTSAIIAVQQASAIPLELQRRGFYQFVEDYVRVMVDIMRADYGIRNIRASVDVLGREGMAALQQQLPMMGQNPKDVMVQINFNDLNTANLELKVDVGAATYWSETMQLQTLDNLFKSGILQDAVLYLESVPDKYVPNKNKMLDKLKEQQQIQQQIMQQQAQAEIPPMQPMVDQNQIQQMARRAIETQTAASQGAVF